MQVNVFISTPAAVDEVPSLLVLPYGPAAAIPRHLQGLEWRHLATTMSDDKLLGASAADVQQRIERDGYAVVAPTG